MQNFSFSFLSEMAFHKVVLQVFPSFLLNGISLLEMFIIHSVFPPPTVQNCKLQELHELWTLF